jgi:hypothetical protein
MFYPDIYNLDPPLMAALTKPEDLSDLAIFIPPKKIEIQPPVAAPLPQGAVDLRPAELMQ